jgi:hypothetical protein
MNGGRFKFCSTPEKQDNLSALVVKERQKPKRRFSMNSLNWFPLYTIRESALLDTYGRT